MVYPLLSLKAQIIAMYRRPGFESLLEKWTNRNEKVGLYTDIYDEEIWKTFPSSTDNSAQFFTPDTADSHLGIMINLDWFQPFDYLHPKIIWKLKNLTSGYLLHQ